MTADCLSVSHTAHFLIRKVRMFSSLAVPEHKFAPGGQPFRQAVTKRRGSLESF
jgi:hypothetical protein